MARLTPDWQLPRYHEHGREVDAVVRVLSQSGQAAAPTGGTYRLYDADGALAYEDADLAANVGADGAVTVTIPAAVTSDYTLPQGTWREQWDLTGLTGGATTESFQRLVYVCRLRPHPVITAAQLYGMHPEWSRQVPQAFSDPGQPIEDAWVEMLQRMLGGGVELHRVLNWYTFGVPHKYLAAHFVARAWAADNPNDSRWQRHADAYLKRYESELEHRTALLVDTDEDGVQDSEDLQAAEPELFLADRPLRSQYDDGGRGWT